MSVKKQVVSVQIGAALDKSFSTVIAKVEKRLKDLAKTQTAASKANSKSQERSLREQDKMHAASAKRRSAAENKQAAADSRARSKRVETLAREEERAAAAHQTRLVRRTERHQRQLEKLHARGLSVAGSAVAEDGGRPRRGRGGGGGGGRSGRGGVAPTVVYEPAEPARRSGRGGGSSGGGPSPPASPRPERPDRPIRRRREREEADFGGAAASVGGFVGTVMTTVKPAIELESAIMDVRKVTDDLDDPKKLAAYREYLRNTSKEMPLTQTQLATIGETMGSMGINYGSQVDNGKGKTVSEMEFMTDLAAKFTAAFKVDPEDAAEFLAKQKNIYGFQGDRIAQVGDAINYLGNSRAVNEEQLVRSGIVSSTAAKNVGLSPEQNAAMNALTMEVTKGDPIQTGRSMEKMYDKLNTVKNYSEKAMQAFGELDVGSPNEFTRRMRSTKPGESMGAIVEVLDKLRDAGAAAPEMAIPIFGEDYANEILALANHKDRKAVLDSMEQSQSYLWRGSVDREYDKQKQTTANQLITQGNRLQDAAISFGEAALPAITNVAKVAGAAGDAAAEMSRQMPKFTELASTTALGIAGTMAALRVVGLATGASVGGAVATVPVVGGVLAGAAGIKAGGDAIISKSEERKKELIAQHGLGTVMTAWREQKAFFERDFDKTTSTSLEKYLESYFTAHPELAKARSAEDASMAAYRGSRSQNFGPFLPGPGNVPLPTMRPTNSGNAPIPGDRGAALTAPRLLTPPPVSARDAETASMAALGTVTANADAMTVKTATVSVLASGMTAPLHSARDAEAASMAALPRQFGSLMAPGGGFAPGVTGQDLTDEAGVQPIVTAVQTGSSSEAAATQAAQAAVSGAIAAQTAALMGPLASPRTITYSVSAPITINEAADGGATAAAVQQGIQSALSSDATRSERERLGD